MTFVDHSIRFQNLDFIMAGRALKLSVEFNFLVLLFISFSTHPIREFKQESGESIEDISHGVPRHNMDARICYKVVKIAHIR